MKFINKLILYVQLFNAKQNLAAYHSLMSQGILDSNNEVHFKLWVSYTNKIDVIKLKLK